MAVTFNGTNQGLHINGGAATSALQNVAGASICAWVKPSAAPATARGRVVGYSTGTSNGAGRAQLNVTSALKVELLARALDTDGAFVFADPGAALPTGAYSHIACTINYATQTGTLFVNGGARASAVMTTTAGNTSNTASLSATIGCREQLLADFFPGDIEDARVFPYVLTTDEILTIASARRDGFIEDSLRAWFLMHDGPPGGAIVVAHDLSNFKEDATPVNAPTFAEFFTNGRRAVA